MFYQNDQKSIDVCTYTVSGKVFQQPVKARGFHPGTAAMADAVVLGKLSQVWGKTAIKEIKIRSISHDTPPSHILRTPAQPIAFCWLSPPRA